MHPVGPEPAAVYWRRRALVAGGAVVLLVILVMIIKAAAGGGSEAPKANTRSNDAVPTLSGSPSPIEETPFCTQADIEVEAEATDSTFPAPAKPTFTVAVRNKGIIKCVIDPASVNVHITSGDDRIFDSGDNCDVAGEGQEPPANTESETEPDTGATQSDEELLDELDGAEVETTVDPIEPADDAGLTSADALSGLTPPASSQVVLLEPGSTEPILVPWTRERSAPSCEDYLLTTPGNGTYHAVFTVAGVASNDVVFELS